MFEIPTEQNIHARNGRVRHVERVRVRAGTDDASGHIRGGKFVSRSRVRHHHLVGRRNFDEPLPYRGRCLADFGQCEFGKDKVRNCVKTTERFSRSLKAPLRNETTRAVAGPSGSATMPNPPVISTRPLMSPLYEFPPDLAAVRGKLGILAAADHRRICVNEQASQAGGGGFRVGLHRTPIYHTHLRPDNRPAQAPFPMIRRRTMKRKVKPIHCADGTCACPYRGRANEFESQSKEEAHPVRARPEDGHHPAEDFPSGERRLRRVHSQDARTGCPGDAEPAGH